MIGIGTIIWRKIMSRSELVKKGKRWKAATIVSGIATIASIFTFNWVLVVFLCILTGVFLFQTMKSYASSGMRF